MAETSLSKTAGGRILSSLSPENIYFRGIKGGRNETIRGVQEKGNPLSGFVVD